MTIESGALILADYTATIKDTGQIIDTTRKEDAEKAGTADPTRNYEPRLIAVGEGWVLKGLDEALQGADPGKTIDVELPPEKAFGSRDPNKVSRIPIRKFGDKASELSVGAEVEVDNRLGIVRSLESGRAIVDFNHRYAGKTIQYNVEIKKKLETNDEKIEGLIRRRLPLEREKLKFEANGEKEIKITIPSDYFLVEGLQIIKRGISTDFFKFLKPLEKVTFVEEYENPAAKKAEEAKLAEETTTKPEEKKEELKAETEESAEVAESDSKEEEAEKETTKEEAKAAPAAHSKKKK